MHLILLLVILLPVSLLNADALTHLPEAWQNTLNEVAEPDLSALEKTAHDSVTGARIELDQLLSQTNPPAAKLAEAYGRLGALYHVYGINVAAERCYANARTLAPEVFRWVYYAAWLALGTDRPDIALQRFNEAKKLDADYAALSLRTGQTLLELNQLDEARIALGKALETTELRAAALYYNGQIDLLQRSYGNAIKQFVEVLALDPEADRLYFFLAQAARGNGDLERARKYLKMRGKRPPRANDSLVDELDALKQGARPHYIRAMQALHQNNYSSAATAFADGLQIDPKNTNARISLMRALWLSGEKGPAEILLEKIIRQQPNQPIANYFQGLILYAKDKPALARKHFLRTLEADAGHFGALLQLAHIHFNKEEFSRAAERYTAALHLRDDIPPASLLRLVALKHSGTSHQEIKPQLEAASRRYSNYPLLRYALARLLAWGGTHENTGRARSIIKKLTNGRPMPEYYEVMALCAASENRFEKAKALQQQAIAGALWMGRDIQHMAKDLSDYEKQKLPAEPWPEDDPSLQPPSPDPWPGIRNYPVPVPF